MPSPSDGRPPSDAEIEARRQARASGQFSRAVSNPVNQTVPTPVVFTQADGPDEKK